MKKKTSQSSTFPWWTLWLIPILTFGVLLFSLSDTNLILDWFGISLSDLDRIPIIGDSIADNAERELLRDWLEREGGYVASWWLLSSLAGAAIFPLLFRILPALPDRGYSASRAAGLMMTGFLYWFMTSLTLTRNEVGSIVFAWVLVVIFSALAWLRWEERPTMAGLRKWVRESVPIIVIIEVLFLVMFVGWAYIQAHNPEIASTEKPMEVMFINGIRASEVFPPQDPWMAGYSISYYYFGYVLVAGLADMSGVATGIAFNLANALVFALAATGITGLLYNLVRGVGPLGRWRPGSRGAAIGVGLLAATMLVLMGNLSTVLVELPMRGYASGLDVVDQDYFLFWDVKDRDLGGPNNPGIIDLNNDSVPDWEGENLPVERWRYWWWFAHSRVVQDRNFDNNLSGEPIVEFPNFSFILSDNHPHVLALPFAVLALTLAAGLALRQDGLVWWEYAIYAVLIGGMVFMNAWDAVYIVIAIAAEALRRLIRNGTGGLTGLVDLIDVVTLRERRERNLYLVGPVLIALLVFIFGFKVSVFDNMPFIVALLVTLLLTPIITLLVNWALGDHDLGGVVRFAAILGGLTYIFYLPWTISFTSQANGIYPNIIYPTRYQQFFNQFGIFMVILGFFMVLEVVRSWERVNWAMVMSITLLGIFIVVGVTLLATWVLDTRCTLTAGESGLISTLEEPERGACEARQQLFGTLKRENEDLISNVLSRRLRAVPNQLFLLLIIGFIGARLFSPPDERTAVPYNPMLAVVLLFIAAGAVIALVPDVFYIRDNFNWRMNTIFKMYYQAWLLFSVGSAYGVYRLFSAAPTLAIEPPRAVMPDVLARALSTGAIIFLFIGAGLVYPYFAIQSRYVVETSRQNLDTRQLIVENKLLTLDGGKYSGSAIAQDDRGIIACLNEKVESKADVTLVEAPYDGGYWNNGPYGRVSMMTGIPTLMGWGNHERQWRGESFYEIDGAGAGQRVTDARALYSARDWESAKTIIDKYGIDYVVVGSLERIDYGTDQRALAKFSELFEPVCTSGNAVVYYVGVE